MRDRLRGINVRHHEALSRLFVVQVALVAACFFVEMDGPPPVSHLLIHLSFFVWPLIATWPARRGWMLRGVMTNALAILLTVAYYLYPDRLFMPAVWLRLLPILAFGMVSGMAAGGLVERRRSRLRAVGAGQPTSTQLPPPSVTACSYFDPAEAELPCFGTCGGSRPSADRFVYQ